MQGSFSYTGFVGNTRHLVGLPDRYPRQKVELAKFSIDILPSYYCRWNDCHGTHEIEEYLVKTNTISEQQINRPWSILEPKKQ